MRISEIINQLSSIYENLTYSIISDVIISDVDIYCNQFNQLSENVLYIIADNNFKSIDIIDMTYNFIAVTENNIEFKNNINIINVHNSVNIKKLFNDVKSALYNDNILQTHMSEFYSYIYIEEYLEPLMEKAFSIIKNPIMFQDYTRTVIAEKHDEPVLNKVWNRALEKDYIENNSFDENFYKIVYELTETNGPLYLPAEKDTCIFLSIKYKSNYFGHIIVLEINNKISDNDLKILRVVADIIKIKSVESLLKTDDEYFYSNIMKDLIIEKINCEYELNFRIKTCNWILKKFNKIILIKINANKSLAFNHYLKRRISNLFNNIKTYTQDEFILILEECNDQSEMIIKEQIKDFIDKFNLIAGISDVFENLMDFKKYYNQAKKSIYYNDIFQLNQSINNYCDYKFIDFIKQCCDKIDYEDYYNQAVIDLRNYDDKNNSEMGITLYHYLDNNKSILKTSKIMHLHENTINLRIQKIKKLLQLDLENTTDTLHILLSYKIKNFSDKFKI